MTIEKLIDSYRKKIKDLEDDESEDWPEEENVDDTIVETLTDVIQDLERIQKENDASRS